LERIVHLLHPIMPFITEALWQQMAGEGTGMLIAAPWPADDGFADEAASEEMEWVVSHIAAIRAARSEMNVPASAELSAATSNAAPGIAEWSARHNEQIKRLARLKDDVFVDAAEQRRRGDGKSTLLVMHDTTTVALDVGGAVDLAKERARLQKEASTLQSELDKIGKKLANPQFLEKAKPEVVEEQRERQGEAAQALARLNAAIARIGAG
jgi:valyl-tRNA synthetase